MNYEDSYRTVRIIGTLDIVLSVLPILLSTILIFLFGFITMMGGFNSGYIFLDWILLNTMTIEPVAVDYENPGQAADLRMFRCSVWGIAIIFNLVELIMASLLLQALKRSKTEEPFMAWIAVKAGIIFVMFVLLIALLSTGSAFLGLLPSIIYLIYRGVAFWLVFRHYKIIRDMGGVP